jgi:cytochrome c oxidase subunit II
MGRPRKKTTNGKHIRQKKVNTKDTQNKRILEWVFLIILIIAIFPIASMIFNLSKESGTSADQQVRISMSGFTPPKIEMKAGVTQSIELVNLDNNMHSDGGGWHQFASDELVFNYKVAPEKKKMIELTIDKPGVYTFYCDICCGGKENPTMQGQIIVS